MHPAAVPVSATQRRVLEMLKRHGAATVEVLAGALSITPSAVRQHLAALRSAGYVTSEPERGRTGRPAERFHPTASSEELFASESSLTVTLLGLIDEEDPTLVDRLFERHRKNVVAETSASLEGLAAGERIAAVTKLLDAQGFLADCEPLGDGRYHIHLHSCPIWNVANGHRQACAAELGVIQDLLPATTVRRTTHKTGGAHTCTYEIEPET